MEFINQLITGVDYTKIQMIYIYKIDMGYGTVGLSPVRFSFFDNLI